MLRCVSNVMRKFWLKKHFQILITHLYAFLNRLLISSKPGCKHLSMQSDVIYFYSSCLPIAFISFYFAWIFIVNVDVVDVFCSCVHLWKLTRSLHLHAFWPNKYSSLLYIRSSLYHLLLWKYATRKFQWQCRPSRFRSHLCRPLLICTRHLWRMRTPSSIILPLSFGRIRTLSSTDFPEELLCGGVPEIFHFRRE